MPITQKIKPLLLISLITPFALFGCAKKLTETECQTNSLYHMGLADGNAGHSANDFATYQEQCNVYQITLDHNAYQQGWQEGIRSYCQPDTAFNLGKSGEGFPAACTDYNVTDLRNEYNRGHEIYQRIQLIQRQISDIDNQMNSASSIEAEMQSVRSRLIHVEEQAAESSTPSHQKRYRKEAKELKAHLRLLEGKYIAATAIGIAKQSELQRKKDGLYRELEGLKATP